MTDDPHPPTRPPTHPHACVHYPQPQVLLHSPQLACHVLYKSWAFGLPSLAFAFSSGFSGQPLFASIPTATFHLLWTGGPPVAFALLEQDIAAASAMKYPAVYGNTMRQVGRSVG